MQLVDNILAPTFPQYFLRSEFYFLSSPAATGNKFVIFVD